jgi:hypothetical protein
MAVKFSGLRSGRALHPRMFLDTYLCQRLSQQQGHSAAGRIRYIEKKINYLIGNRTRDLTACSIVPQPITLPRIPNNINIK